MYFSKETKKIDGISFIDIEDVALFKIDSLVDRGANKDAYDLDFITEEKGGGIDLFDLWNLYQDKRRFLSKSNRKNIFDKFRIEDPLNHPEKLKQIDRFDWIFPCQWVSEIDALKRWNAKVDTLLIWLG